MRAARRGLTVLAAALAVGACSASEGPVQTGPKAPAEGARIEVVNNNWSDMVVYLVRPGMRFRLGAVTSMTTEHFRVPAGVDLAVTDVRLLANAIGSSESFATQTIQVGQGQRVEFTIANHLGISSYSVWSR